MYVIFFNDSPSYHKVTTRRSVRYYPIRTLSECSPTHQGPRISTPAHGMDTAGYPPAGCCISICNTVSLQKSFTGLILPDQETSSWEAVPQTSHMTLLPSFAKI